MIIIGTLFLMHTLLGMTLPIKELLPVALVALGAYMLFDYIRRGRASDRIVRFDSRRPPPSVVASTKPVDATNFRTGEKMFRCAARELKRVARAFGVEEVVVAAAAPCIFVQDFELAVVVALAPLKHDLN